MFVVIFGVGVSKVVGPFYSESAAIEYAKKYCPIGLTYRVRRLEAY